MPPMANKPLVLDLIEWIATRPRTYADVMDAWRTSCPRLPIWEDAVDHRFVRLAANHDGGPLVEVTDAGHTFLARERGSTPSGSRLAAPPV